MAWGLGQAAPQVATTYLSVCWSVVFKPWFWLPIAHPYALASRRLQRRISASQQFAACYQC
jgi:hypothetical protein